MRFRDVSYVLKAVAEVARAGEQLVGSLDRSRARGHLGSTFMAQLGEDFDLPLGRPRGRMQLTQSASGR